MTALDGEEYALIADGDLRKAEKPKRKKMQASVRRTNCNRSLHNTLLGGQSSFQRGNQNVSEGVSAK